MLVFQSILLRLCLLLWLRPNVVYHFWALVCALSTEFRSYADFQAMPPYLWQFPLQDLCRLPYRSLLSNLTVERSYRVLISVIE
jgi:hypothetical protein